jgi:precorrin-8X/cobalt-precorrin-8 methylmutase
MIHTSADFEYLQSVRFHPEAVSAGKEALKQGKSIITDTNMAREGIRRRDLSRFGCQVNCYISDPRVIEAAAKTGDTRARVAVDMAIEEMQGGIYVIGNAPTALLHLLDRIREGSARPALVIGLPVGFVNAAESKACLEVSNQPYITNMGRKGGSNVAASVVNALISLLKEG